MSPNFKTNLLFLIFLLFGSLCKAQLQVNTETNAQILAQKLVGEGVTVSNVTFTGHPSSAGIFKNISGTNIGIDSGIVLTNGAVKTAGSQIGLDGPSSSFAQLQQGFSGDIDLDGLVAFPTEDACVLEFDFVPLGDSIKFRYVFSSEEYPDFSCSDFNDVFAFFIEGPGFPVKTNIALIPGTTDPVTINNINGESCAVYPQYYVDNTGNANFTHNGHTQVFAALARVQPCQTYHLKLAIADVSDDQYDSGVFLEAKSLTSNAFQLTNLTQLDPVTGNSYLVEGCAVGALKIGRQTATLFSQDVNLGYGGTAINGIDVQTLPSVITIPANQTEVLLNIFPLIDNLPEGIEDLKIYTLAACGAGTPTDSAMIQIRDYDTLGIEPDTVIICRGGSIQLHATAGYSIYQWDPNPALSNGGIREPIVTPTSDSTMFYCTSTEGTCHARDSAFIYWKRVKLQAKIDVNCNSASTGQITVTLGPGWEGTVQYSINNNPYQAANVFSNLPIGTYTIKAKDITGCIDSVVVDVVQAFPDLLITGTVPTNGSCTGGADGSITVTATGGKPNLLYSTDGTNFQASNLFSATPGTYTVTVKDANGCTNAVSGVIVGFDNTMTLSMDANPTICEGKNTTIAVTTNGTSVVWTPAATLNDATSFTPVATPTTTTEYYVTSTLGVCSKTDSITVFVNLAPRADAGPDFGICFGASTQLLGSGGVTYNWTPSRYLSNPGIKDPLVTEPLTTTYYLSVIDANGCESLTKDDVILTVAPPAQLFIGADTSVAINQPLQLLAHDINNIGFINYTWTPSAGLNNPNIPNPIAIFSDAVTYLLVTATTADHCQGLARIKVNTYKGPEIYVASSFTPNADGTNDVLRAFPVGIKIFKYFRVYNRFGELIFSTTNANVGWDGRYKGVMQGMSSFVWIAEGIDYLGKLVQRKGSTTIIQ